jgi:hypothetical protein
MLLAMIVRVPYTTLLEYIPVAATIVTTILSVVLARATLRYAKAADRGLELSREQFEREWAPELHVRLERASTADARIIITNLARASVLLQLVQLRTMTHAMPFERQYLNDPLVGGNTWNEHIGDRILAITGNDFEGTIAASDASTAVTGSALTLKLNADDLRRSNRSRFRPVAFACWPPARQINSAARW